MKLADTCTILWLTEDTKKLSLVANQALRLARLEGGIALSAMSLLEIARLQQKGRIELRINVLDYLKHLEKLCVILPINAEIALLAVTFSARFPKDPANRTIAATAIHYGLPLVTSDKRIRASNEVTCIW